MFNWTTTTIVNSLKDLSTGLDLVKVWSDAEKAEGQDLPAGFSGQYPVIKIKRDHTFEARYIRNVYKATGHGAQFFEVKIDGAKLLTSLKAAVDVSELKRGVQARLSFYIALEGSEESIYANDLYQKGKPFSIGFTVKDNDTAESLLKKIKRNAEKFSMAIYGRKIFDLSINGLGDNANLILKGTHEYQRIKMAAVVIDDMIDEILVDIYEDGIVAGEGGKIKSEGAVFELVNRGLNGFGTAHHLIKDLRLPTIHNNKWLHLREDEKPVAGAKYDQFIVTYCAPSMANPGLSVVGQHNMSVTTHVFWVNQAISAEFASYFTTAGGTPVEVNTITPATENTPEEVKQVLREEGGKNFPVNHEQKVKDSEDVVANDGK